MHKQARAPVPSGGRPGSERNLPRKVQNCAQAQQNQCKQGRHKAFNNCRHCQVGSGREERSGPPNRRLHQGYSRLSSPKSSDSGFIVWRATEQDPVVKEAKSDAELEDMILQRLLIGGVFVSVRRDPILGWRPTVVTAPKHTKNAQELADKIAAELRKKFTLKE